MNLITHRTSIPFMIYCDYLECSEVNALTSSCQRMRKAATPFLQARQKQLCHRIQQLLAYQFKDLSEAPSSLTLSDRVSFYKVKLIENLSELVGPFQKEIREKETIDQKITYIKERIRNKDAPWAHAFLHQAIAQSETGVTDQKGVMGVDIIASEILLQWGANFNGNVLAICENLDRFSHFEFFLRKGVNPNNFLKLDSFALKPLTDNQEKMLRLFFIHLPNPFFKRDIRTPRQEAERFQIVSEYLGDFSRNIDVFNEYERQYLKIMTDGIAESPWNEFSIELKNIVMEYAV